VAACHARHLGRDGRAACSFGAPAAGLRGREARGRGAALPLGNFRSLCVELHSATLRNDGIVPHLRDHEDF
jgi:hypothetical protein